MTSGLAGCYGLFVQYKKRRGVEEATLPQTRNNLQIASENMAGLIVGKLVVSFFFLIHLIVRDFCKT